MRKFTALASALFLTLGVMAQDLPQPSPAASTTQRVGLTDIQVNYSRPSVKGRTTFGDLVPYGEMWRTGANKATKVMVSTDVMFGEQTLKAGTYSLFTIPNEDEWVVIFNKDTELSGTNGYTQRNDALRIRVKPTAAPMTESFRISVENITTNTADLVLAWDKIAVAVPMKVEVDKQSEANIEKALAETSGTYRSAATFYAGKGDNEKALKYIDQSIAMNNYWYTNWQKAEILAAMGDKKAAKKQGELAIQLGEEHFKKLDQPFNYKEGLEKTMKSW